MRFRTLTKRKGDETGAWIAWLTHTDIGPIAGIAPAENGKAEGLGGVDAGLTFTAATFAMCQAPDWKSAEGSIRGMCRESRRGHTAQGGYNQRES